MQKIKILQEALSAEIESIITGFKEKVEDIELKSDLDLYSHQEIFKKKFELILQSANLELIFSFPIFLN